MTRLSPEEAMRLLEVQTISGKPQELERLRKWIERLVESRGKAYVVENRRDLLSQWEAFLKSNFKSCV